MNKKIALYNLEPKYKNLALEKIKMFYLKEGHEVEDYFPLNHDNYSKIFCSSIFRFTSKRYVTPDMEVGGTGFEGLLSKSLPKEIEIMKPKHLNAGFLSRGCLRKCSFCYVPEKEPKLQAVADIFDIWDGESKLITDYSNNIMALPDHLKKICQQVQNQKGLTIDFNQGLDIRLTNRENLKILKSTKIFRYRFAFDSDNMYKIIKEKCKLLKEFKISGALFYVYCNSESDMNEIIERVNVLKANRQRGYLMRDQELKGNKKYIALAKWINTPAIQAACNFDQFLKYDHDGMKYRKYFKEGIK